MINIKQAKRIKKQKILLWLDRDLIKIIKDHDFNLDEGLGSFFKYNNKMLNGNTEVTFDSFDQVQKFVQSLCQFDAQLNTLSHNFNLIKSTLVDIGVDIFDEEYSDDNECNRLSAYYGALHEYENKQKENILKKQKEGELYESMRRNVVIKKITVGNEKVTRRHRSSGISNVSLHLHHILFKGMRVTFPGIPYLCMQTPREHHDAYHNDSERTDINFHNFSNMVNYLASLQVSILDVSNSMRGETSHGQYSNICSKAAELAIDCQKYWIGQKYSWLYNVQNSKHLLLVQRLIAVDCFPNNVLVNQYLYEQKIESKIIKN